MDIAQAAAIGAAIPPLICGPKNIAVSLRHRFYRFRIEMIRQEHPYAAALPDLTVIIEQHVDSQYYLHFQRLGFEGPLPEAGEARALREAAHAHERTVTAQELIERPFDEIPDAPDHTEDAVEAYLGLRPSGVPPKQKT
jgi:hypothetical protein